MRTGPGTAPTVAVTLDERNVAMGLLIEAILPGAGGGCDARTSGLTRSF